MSIDIKPETERLVHEEIQRGHFRSVDELIVEGVNAWREKQETESAGPRQRSTLSEFLLNSPLTGSDLKLDRDRKSVV